ncbi:hypothetical protein LIER_26163 [Lithospermum erythrorhizon]|uniref:DNA-directed RNA polymerase n=1 Tax=Lithospermum erythrorhizon TaxID=34254 RepID=A0AAV3R8X1_LITER
MYIDRNTIGGHNLLFQDYFADSPTYGPRVFQRRFRMRRDLFIRIKDAIEANDSYFVQRRNAAGKLGLSALQKVTAAFQMLTYGITGDLTDEYIRIGETTAIKSMKRFVKAIIHIFGSEYLRSPNIDDIARLLAKAEQRGTPGMLGSIDYMYWE